MPRLANRRSEKKERYHVTTFTRDWFGPNVEVWSLAFAKLVGLPDLVFLEIGAFEGRATCWLLANVLTGANARIHCIDPFAGPLLERFKQNIEPWHDRVHIHVGRSETLLPTLPGPFDMIYVDGLHMAFNVLQDAVLSWNKLKVGGYMVFDDYLWGHQHYERTLTPKDGVDGFLSVIHGRYQLIHIGLQVIIRKNDQSPRFEQEYARIWKEGSPDLEAVFH